MKTFKLFMQTIQVQDKTHLQRLIQYHLESYGPDCSLNHLDISAVTDLSTVFYESPFNGDISQWDTSNVTNMSYLLALSPVCVDKNGASPAKPGAVWALAILPQPSSSRGTTRLGDRA